ncbi:hypothetical protein [Bifidobacterium sp. SO1]|uniref:hypothetical protein n=1 Tax=Bifidobacterium sp. SO1 TaxID=2809029 RepID=UPI001BDD18F5|nr:hypothetical protein [Bifidobacterium sp. SO1]MBT1161727.1 hypothetical protein [Bifidobacterium sp. SO1]
MSGLPPSIRPRLRFGDGRANVSYAYEGREPWRYGIIPLILGCLIPPLGVMAGIIGMIRIRMGGGRESRSYRLAVGGVVMGTLIMLLAAMLTAMTLSLIPVLDMLAGYASGLANS